MLQGKVSAAMRWIGSNTTGILEASDDVVGELIKKHPKHRPAAPGNIFEGAPSVESVIFENIDGTLTQV